MPECFYSSLASSEFSLSIFTGGGGRFFFFFFFFFLFDFCFFSCFFHGFRFDVFCFAV